MDANGVEADANGQVEAPGGEPPADESTDAAGEATNETGAPDAMAPDRDASPEASRADTDAQVDAQAAREEVAVDRATWSHIYNDLLANMSYASNCAGEGCHSPGVQKGFDLSSQDNGYVTVQAKLVPGNPDASIIVIELQTGMMPRGSRPRMPAADLELIRAWILAGAAND